MAKKITKNMTFAEVLQAAPEAGEIMSNYGLHCIGCMMAHSETVEQGCKGHDMDEEKVEKMLEEINKTLEKKK